MLETFYEHLGARKLSSRIRHEYIPTGIQTHPSPEAQDLRKHVLERLTIFLADQRRFKTDYTAEGLAQGDNFLVKEARSVESRYEYSSGRDMYPHTEVS
jgi:hypothetical protein